MHVCAIARAATVDQIAAVVGRASAAGVECHPLSMFAAGVAPRSGLVLGYGGIATADIDEGMRRLRSCFGG
jgi:GntR family transcriptional regulator/MocR family aminotransferase